MEIRDVIHGSIVVDRTELPIIDSPYFQRLRQIRQLGFAEHSYPSATHNRYVHSLGAMETATRVFDVVFGGDPDSAYQSGRDDGVHRLKTSNVKDFERFRSLVRIAALLHDVGHGPLSHTSEIAMPQLKTLGSFGSIERKPENRKATHEDYTLKFILDSGLTPLIDSLGSNFGFSAKHVAALIDREIETGDDFFKATVTGAGTVDFKPILQQLISSELDSDRMDYLRRDSWYAGVSYGQFDFDWLCGNLTSFNRDGKLFLAIQHKALFSFEDFLISRFHMFLMVYFHYKSVIFDEMLGHFLASKDCNFSLPSDIEAYAKTHDGDLYAHLAASQNPWAKRITEKKPYRMLIELHSGIPATPTAMREQAKQLDELKADLESRSIHFISTKSTGEFSKYFKKSEAFPIFVRYDNQYNAVSYIPLDQCTDLFKRYNDKRTIMRLYVSPEDYVHCKNEGRGYALKYEDEVRSNAHV